MSDVRDPTGAPPDIGEFLRAHPPFDVLAPAELDAVAAQSEIEFHAGGTTILSQGEEPVSHVRVVRSGAVELRHSDRVLDELGEGEMFGQASMLSGLPTGFAARAVEDTLCYRIPAEVARQVLARPEAMRFVARSLLDRSIWQATVGATLGSVEPERDPGRQPVSALLRSPLVLCPPDASIRDVARRMTAAGATSAVVELDSSLGIVTDRDLRSRVVAAGLSTDAPVTEAMSAPAYTVAAERLGSDVLLDMLDRGFRHFPVLSATGRVLGVVEDSDLVAVEARSSFFLRQAIGRASTVDDLAAATAGLRPMAVALHDAGLDAVTVEAVYSVVLDALVRRLVELALAELGTTPAPFSWLALGSQARRESVPGSDVDSAISWYGPSDDPGIRDFMLALGRRVTEGLVACGLRNDARGATAGEPLVVRSADSWAAATRSWLDDPRQDQAIILVSVMVDSRPVWGVHTGTPVADTFRLVEPGSVLLRMLARFALSHRPPTGFLRGLVVEHDGEHRGRLDLKHGGVIPIVDLARWAAMAAGVTSASTIERLRAAGTAGTLPAADAQTLEDAFELIAALRMQHQVRQLRAGDTPDDYVDPAELSGLTRSHLKEAFRAVASVQKRVAADLKAGTL